MPVLSSILGQSILQELCSRYHAPAFSRLQLVGQFSRDESGVIRLADCLNSAMLRLQQIGARDLLQTE